MLVVEFVCNLEGPKYILRIQSVAKLNSVTLKEMVIKALVAVCHSGGKRFPVYVTIAKQTMLFVENWVDLANVMLKLLTMIFFVFDYLHLFKNIRNN